MPVSPQSQRDLALILGCVLAGIVLVVWSMVVPGQGLCFWVESSEGTSVQLSLQTPPADGACTENPGATITDAHRRLLEPLVKSELGADGRSARAEFSRSWAERRALDVVLGEGSITIHASYATEYGDFAGEIDAASSSAHRHANALCFDLNVRRMDGSSRPERWRGQIPLP